MPNLAWSNASAAHSAQDALDDVCSAMPRLTSGVAVDRRKSCSVQSGSPTISSSWLLAVDQPENCVSSLHRFGTASLSDRRGMALMISNVKGASCRAWAGPFFVRSDG